MGRKVAVMLFEDMKGKLLLVFFKLMKKEIKFLVFLYFIIVIVKVIFSSFIPTISIFSDEYLYAKMARSFFYHGEFSIHGIPTSQYLPLYPIFLSVAYLFQDMQLVYLAMKVINA